MAQQPRAILRDDAQDERLAAVPLSAAYTYAYLPTVLDDMGRVKDQPAVLNGLLWPLRADDHPTPAMAADLEALIDADLLCRYVVDDVSYLHDPRWRKRQRIPRASSDLPPCPLHDRVFDEVVADAMNRMTDQVRSMLGDAGVNEKTVRTTAARVAQDVSFLVDPNKAASVGAKVREFLGERPSTGEDKRDVDVKVERTDNDDTWSDATDDPDAHRDDTAT